MILEKLIASLPSVRIIVDGLDECPPKDHEEVIEALLKMKTSESGACKVLFSSRNVQSISKLLRKRPTARLDDYTESINHAITSFVNTQLESLHRDFTPSLVDSLGQKVIAKADGRSILDSRGAHIVISIRNVSLG